MELFIVYYDTGMDDFQLLGIYNDRGHADDDLEDYFEKYGYNQSSRRFFYVEKWDLPINSIRNL